MLATGHSLTQTTPLPSTTTPKYVFSMSLTTPLPILAIYHSAALDYGWNMLLSSTLNLVEGLAGSYENLSPSMLFTCVVKSTISLSYVKPFDPPRCPEHMPSCRLPSCCVSQTPLSLGLQAVHLAPGCALLYSSRSAAYFKRGWIADYWAALQDAETAISLDPLLLKAYCRRILALVALGQLQAGHPTVKPTRFCRHNLILPYNHDGLNFCMNC